MAVYANRGAFGLGPKSTSTYQKARKEALSEATERAEARARMRETHHRVAEANERAHRVERHTVLKEHLEETMENIITIDGERVVDLVEVSPGLWMTPEDARARS